MEELTEDKCVCVCVFEKNEVKRWRSLPEEEE